jgi:hypothetical protein
MASFTQIFNSATKKGLNIESFTQLKDRWDEKVIPTTVIRVEIKEFIWFTWEFSTYGKFNSETLEMEKEFNESEYLMFKGRYSQITGATQNTYRKERMAFKVLEI